MARTEGERDRAEKLKDSLLRAAAEMVREGGIASLSMRKVAAVLNYTTTTIYYHFGSRDALLAGVRMLAWGKLYDALESALTTESWSQRAVDMACAYLQFALAEPALYHVCFLSGPEHEEAADSDDPTAELRSYRLFEKHVQEGVDAGAIQFEDGRRAALHFWSWSHGLASLMIGGSIPLAEDPESREAVVRSLASEFIEQLTSHSAGSD